MRAIISFVTLGLFMALAGCNTMEGLGQDVEQGGDALSDQAQETQRTM